MKNHATATFKNTSHNSERYGAAVDEPPLSRVSIEREFAGDLIGNSTAELLACQPSQDRFSYVGTDRFTGRLKDRSGSFVFQHGGKHEKGILHPFGYVVPGSGTQELQGLLGEIKISVTSTGEHTVELDYEFE
jgi:Protein of unknown function (DUF3224)